MVKQTHAECGWLHAMLVGVFQIFLHCARFRSDPVNNGKEDEALKWNVVLLWLFVVTL